MRSRHLPRSTSPRLTHAPLALGACPPGEATQGGQRVSPAEPGFQRRFAEYFRRLRHWRRQAHDAIITAAIAFALLAFGLARECDDVHAQTPRPSAQAGNSAAGASAPAAAPASAPAGPASASPSDGPSSDFLPGSEGAEKMNPEIYDAMYQRYLESARQTTIANNRVSQIDWMANLAGDPRARRVNDLVTIRVAESIVGSGTADAQLNKNSSANLGVPKLFGLESKLPSAVDPTALVSASSDTKFKGGGVTTRTGDLTAIMTARVTEVLPNGDLVLEGAREIDINGDRQIVVLTGVVRQVDIGSQNVVSSQSIGQLRIRYFGRGMMKDNLKPGFLVRMLNKIF